MPREPLFCRLYGAGVLPEPSWLDKLSLAAMTHEGWSLGLGIAAGARLGYAVAAGAAGGVGLALLPLALATFLYGAADEALWARGLRALRAGQAAGRHASIRIAVGRELQAAPPAGAQLAS